MPASDVGQDHLESITRMIRSDVFVVIWSASVGDL